MSQETDAHRETLLRRPSCLKPTAARSVETSALSVLVLLLSDSLLLLENCLSVLVDLKGSDHAVGGVNGDLRLLS